MSLAGDPAVRCGGRGSVRCCQTIRHAAVRGPSACIFMHRNHTWEHALMPRTGRCSGAGAVLVAVPGGLVAYVPGAVTGIESKAVIDGTSLSGVMSQDRPAFSSAQPFSSAQQGARRSQRAEIRELAARAGLKGARLARGY